MNVDVQVNQLGHEKDGFLSHYYVNGIFCGLNYTPKQYGSDINITGDANVNTNGTAIHSGGTSFITIGGGGTVEIQKETVNYALNAEEGFISMNVKLDRLPGGRKDEMPKVVAPGTHTTKIHGNIALINREDRPANSAGLVPTIINLGLTTADSEWIGTVMDGYKENPKMKPEQKQIREQTGLNLYLMNGAKWKNEMWGTYPSTFTGSKVRSITGGESAQNAGIIYQNHFRNITVNNFSGFVRVLYERNKTKTTTIDGGDIIIKAAKEGSHLILRTSHVDGLDVKAQNETLSNLATKLQYTGEKGKLTGTVEIAEGLMEAKISKDIEFQDDGHGKYIPEITTPPVQDTEVIEKVTDGYAVGREFRDGTQTTFDKDVVVNVSGKGISGGKNAQNVTGIYILNNSKVNFNKNIKITVKNADPATRGTSEGADVAHYYMSGIYVGYGSGGYKYSQALIKGNVDIDVVGVGIQANKDGYIYVDGGGNITTHALTGSDTYALLSEEGLVAMNVKFDSEGYLLGAGNHDVNVYGNLGILNKNYGIDPNLGAKESYIALGLATANSKLTGAVLNEFDENGNNTNESGVDLYLQNGATWINRWIGAERVKAPRKDAETYLFKGSKVHNFYGGKTEAETGFIEQEDGDRPIDIEHYNGYTVVKYAHDGKGKIQGGDIRIEEAFDGSGISIRTKSLNGLKVGTTVADDQTLINKTLAALAQKLVYQADDGKLKAKVEIAEGLATPSISKVITYFDENHHGVYDSTGVVPKKPKKFEKHTQGAATGHGIYDDQKESYDDVIINVSGSGVTSEKTYNNVVGLYVLDGGQADIKGNLKVTVKNPRPALRGSSEGADIAHYYMSGVYAGYG
ncbi:hypothetical protein HMPREF3191_01155, partial [Veillonellaceae bacterium DNF00626]